VEKADGTEEEQSAEVKAEPAAKESNKVFERGAKTAGSDQYQQMAVIPLLRGAVQVKVLSEAVKSS
jgi:hypothetical protein